jgi:O-antigen/teichoic acid export membrane protein
MIFFGMMKDTVMIGLHVNKRTKVIGSVITAMAVLNLVLNILLIPIWGIVGTAVATLFSQFIFFLAIYYYAQKSYPIPYEEFKIVKIFIVASVLYGVSLVSNYWDWFYRIPFKLFLAATYPFLLYFLKFYEQIELDTIQNIFKNMIQKSPTNRRKT